MEFYDLLQRRCPPKKIQAYLPRTPSLTCDELSKQLDALPPYYARGVVRVLVEMFENGLLEDPDETLAEVLYHRVVTLPPTQDPTPQQDIITYAITDRIRPHIAETPRLIAHGTTGHRTWEASLYLCVYLLRNSPPRRIVELGAGTGLVSTALAMAGHDVVSTDGSASVVRQLQQTFELNEVTPNATAHVLRWGVDQLPPLSPCADLVVAADVTYDTAVIPSLCSCLQQTHAACLVACTVRNQSTLSAFEQHCRRKCMAITLVASTDTEPNCIEHLMFGPLVCPVRIYRVSPNQGQYIKDDV